MKKRAHIKIRPTHFDVYDNDHKLVKSYDRSKPGAQFNAEYDVKKIQGKLNEDAPTNNVGGGNIAATSPGQEPPGKLKRPYRQGGGGIRTDLIRRWMKGCK